MKSTMRGPRRLGGLRACSRVGGGVTVNGFVLVRGRGEITIGDEVTFDAALAPIELNAVYGARIEIARGARIGPGVSIEAGDHIRVGADTNIGSFAKILDNNWHRTVGDREDVPSSSPVVIGEGAEVGARSVLLPGAVLGDGASLLDDSVLSRRVPAGMSVEGVPARAIRELEHRRGATSEDSPLTPFRFAVLPPQPTGGLTLRWLAALEWLERRGPGRASRAALKKVQMLVAWVVGGVVMRHANGRGRVYGYGPFDVDNAGLLRVGDRVIFLAGLTRSRLYIAPGATLEIGDDVRFNYGTQIRAHAHVHIGSSCLFGSHVLILDSHHGRTEPVTVEDDVWLAHGVTVLPGVRIGHGSVIAAGSVVDRDVPPNSIGTGSPLRIVSLAALGLAPPLPGP